MKIRVTEQTPPPKGEHIARGMSWLAAIVGAPFSGGLSLLVGPFMEGFLRTEARRQAAEALDDVCPEGRDEAGDLLADLAESGCRSGAVRYGARTNGFGYVSKDLAFDVEDE